MQLTAWISLAALVVAVVVGVAAKRNVGLIAVIMAFIVGYFFCGLSMKSIYMDGWPTQVFFTTIGVMLLFGSATDNGTMQILVDTLVSLTRGKDRLLPVIMFAGSYALCALGAGIPFCSALLPISFAIARSRRIDPLMMCLCTAYGIIGGGLSPLAIHGATAISLGAAIGVENYMSIWLCMSVTCLVYAAVVYVAFKGYRAPAAGAEETEGTKAARLNKKQTVTLAAIGAVIACVVLFKCDIGLIAFVGGTLLMLFKCADEKRVISGLPWDILLLIGGCSILITVVDKAGGIALASEGLSGAMTADNATGMMVLLSGVLSAVSSAVGVVMPTLFPAAGELSLAYGIPVSRLAGGIMLGSCLLTISPTSTVGGISLASIPNDSDIDKNKFFLKLLIAAIATVILTGAAGLLGLYNFILN